jgi:hypothetical protein
MAENKYKWITESNPAKFTGVVQLEEYSRPNFHKSEFSV